MIAQFSSPASVGSACANLDSDGRSESHVLRRFVLLCAVVLGSWLLATMLHTPAAHADAAPAPTPLAQTLTSTGDAVHTLLGTAPATLDAVLQPVVTTVVRPALAKVVQPVLKNVVRPALTTISRVAHTSPPRPIAAARTTLVAASNSAAGAGAPADLVAARLGHRAARAPTVSVTRHPQGAIARPVPAGHRVPWPAPRPTPSVPASALGSVAFDSVLQAATPMPSATAATSRACNVAPALSYFLEDPSFSPD